MMNHMMPNTMMPGVALFWILAGFLLSLLLVAAIAWLVTRWRNEQRGPQMQAASSFQDLSHTYEQGYRQQERARDPYQEDGYSSLQPQYEQPITQYPQELPVQH